MQLMLWRWSTAVQATSLVMMVLFFAVLARSVRLAEVRWWLRAWTCNLGALAVTLFYWYFHPGQFLPLVRVLYMGGKTAFVALLIHGAWVLKRPGGRILRRRVFLPALLVYAAIGAFLPSIELLGIVQHVTMGVLLAGGAYLLTRGASGSGVGWLVSGFLLRAALSAVEAGAYGLQLVPPARVPADVLDVAGVFMAASSSFDSGAEWLLALGCVLAVSERVQGELRQAIGGLLSAQEEMRALADRDPLTALANRRGLAEVFRAVQPEGALLLFFDLDGFKQINDRHGHQVGDACLKRFASGLRESFRPGDALVRYAGDEFLVVAASLDERAAMERVERLRDRLRGSPEAGPDVHFSVGLARLAPGGHPESAVQAADESMYAAKALRASAPV